MYAGQLVFAQLMDHLPWHTFRRIVERYRGDHRVRDFGCASQFRAMAFAQFTYRDSLRDIETCLDAQSAKLYHLGIRGRVARSTLADANETRDWRIYAEFAQALIAIARPLYTEESFGVELKETVYAFDATTIDLCLSVFPWARYKSTKAAVRLHTLLDLRGNIPTFIHISDGKLNEVSVLDQLIVEPGAFYVMDRGLIDFARLYRFHIEGAFFVIKARSSLRFRRRYTQQVDRSTGLVCDQIIVLTTPHSAERYLEALRRVRFIDPQSGKTLVVLTNNFALPALTICALYRCRWQVELFFKWIKQHLRIKSFFGTTENAVKTQIWIAVSVYVLVAIVRKRLKLDASLYELLQILSLTMFERTELHQLLTLERIESAMTVSNNQLNLFEF